MEITEDEEDEEEEELLIQSMLKEIENLPERCRDIFKLVKIDGLKHREVAEILDISIKTVEAQISIGIKKITASLAKS